MTDSSKYFSAHEALTDWPKRTVQTASRITVVDSPVSKGTHAYRVEVRYGDNPSGCRATLATGPTDGHLGGTVHNFVEGDETYFGFSVYLPSASFLKVDKWRLIFQGKSPNTGSPPFSINVRNGYLILNNRPTTSGSELHIYRTPVSYNRWIKMVLHVKFSPDPNVGFLQFYKDGSLAMAKKFTPTQFLVNGSPALVFVAIGVYRDDTIRSTDVIYHDGFISAETLEDAAQ